MFTPVSPSCTPAQSAVLLQVTPLDQLDPQAVALLEILSTDALDCEEAFYRLCEGQRAHCLTFVRDDQAINLLTILRWFENGMPLHQVASLLSAQAVS